MYIVQIQECDAKFKCKLAFIVKVSEAYIITMQHSRLVPELKLSSVDELIPILHYKLCR